ncbi:DNA replication regulator Sld3 [Trichophyton interdigitale]|nr:DNA replication regulator Sld3 [Trichophyton interdigitale]KAG5216949.1 DNA replication regulator Sld3 [Trichophyton interdigitale]KAG8210121.1 DNA replication regulator Sld3 [Trichophyton interdigitale]
MATCLPLLTTSKVPSTSSLDDSHVPFPPSKRLKLDHDNDGTVGKPALGKFTINPCGTSLSDRPHSLYPIALIPRSRIPLSWLNTCLSPPRRIRPGSLFTANIPALEQSLSGENASTVLAAAISDTVERHYGEVPKEYYVVERVKRHVYAICPLRGEVQEADLAVASKCGGVQDEFGPVQFPSDPFTDSLEFAVIPDIDLFQEILAQDVSFAFEDPPHGGTVSSQADRTGSSPNTALQSPAVATEESPKEGDDIELGINLPAEYFVESQMLPQTNTVNNTEDMLSTLKIQYLEALYISKTSVAYFAKGPLTRARAAFQNSDDASSMRPMVLYHYYRSCIIPMKKMDVKYRDSLPRIIADITQSQSDGDTIAPAKKRKSKKKTIGKDGLYAGEEEFISKWWKSAYETNSSVEKSALEAQRKGLIEDIRMRETQLQILLILEIMLLEGSVGSQAELDEGNTEKPKKPIKKAHDMATALELLLDRLCIWHTVSSHGLAIDVPVNLTKTATGSGKPNNDKLRDFCTEVIIPFYSARLPEKCQVINRKLGGPAISSPARPNRSNQKRSTNPLSKSAKGQSSKRTLQRVRTDEKIPVRAKVPSLARNNTAPATSEVKLESNDQLSFSTSIGGRGGIQKSKRVNNREVDLEAVAKQHESKLKRMNLLVDQKRELDAAINTLRKPNRELAVRDFVESAEKRSASAASHPRKQKNPTRNPFAQGVQVMATPKGPRNKDCGFADLPSLPKTWKQSRPTVMASPIPDPDTQVVPSSSTRPSNSNMLPKSQPTLNFSRSEDLVHETPSKPSSNGLKRSATSNPVESGIEAEFSPILARKSKPCSYKSSSIKFGLDTSAYSTTAEVGETPPRPKQMMFVSESTVPRRVDFMQPSTPAKGSMQHNIHVTTPLRQRAGDDANRTINETPEKSIYERLGWNNDDDDDDELAFF